MACGQDDPVALVSADRAAVMDHLDPGNLARFDPHAVPCLTAGGDAARPACEQRFAPDPLPSVRKLAFHHLVACVESHVMHARPGRSGGPERQQRRIEPLRDKANPACQRIGMGGSDVALRSARVFQRCLVHAQRVPHQRAHRAVIGLAGFERGIGEVTGDKAGDGSKRVAVLEGGAERGGWAQGRELAQCQPGIGGRVHEIGFQIGSGQAGAGAHQMAHLQPGGRLRVSQSKTGQKGRCRGIPLHFPFAHQPREQQRGHSLGVGADHEAGMRIHWQR